MFPLELLCLFRGYPLAYLPPKSLNQQAAAHANATMNPPHSQGQAHLFKSLMPRKHMLIHAVDECAIKIEKQRRSMVRVLIHGNGAPFP
jgi:hypothetical protein